LKAAYQSSFVYFDAGLSPRGLIEVSPYAYCVTTAFREVEIQILMGVFLLSPTLWLHMILLIAEIRSLLSKQFATTHHNYFPTYHCFIAALLIIDGGLPTKGQGFALAFG